MTDWSDISLCISFACGLALALTAVESSLKAKNPSLIDRILFTTWFQGAVTFSAYAVYVLFGRQLQ